MLPTVIQHHMGISGDEPTFISVWKLKNIFNIKDPIILNQS